MALKIIFMGTPEFAVPILEKIHKSNHKVLCVYTQTPNKRDRGQKISITPIHEISKKKKIDVKHPLNLDHDEYEYIKKLKPDVVVVVAYGKIIPAKILELKDIQFLNIHASLLPKWRGAAPIQRAIMNLDKETGISIMKIVPKLDSGPIMMQSKIEIFESTTFEELSNKMSNLGAQMILDSLSLIEKDKAKFFPQQEKDASYAKKIKKSEGKIDWKDNAKKIIAKINALTPNPGCWFELNGIRIKIISAEMVRANGAPGEILNNNFTIACSENAIKIIELKKEGKKKTTAFEFLKGNNLIVGNFVNESI
jgi:methionyl-tRNA formyltransferase